MKIGQELISVNKKIDKKTLDKILLEVIEGE